MNQHLWWYLARAAGVSSWLFGATSVMTGLIMSSKSKIGRRPNWQLDLHRYQGALSLSLLGLHLGALVADSYTSFTLSSLLVPFASSWKPEGVAWGVVAMYLLVAVEVTSLLRRRINARIWRVAHLSSLVAYALSTVHFLRVGTDAHGLAAALLVLGFTAANTGLLVFRILADKPRPASARSARTGVVRRPDATCNDGPR